MLNGAEKTVYVTLERLNCVLGYKDRECPSGWGPSREPPDNLEEKMSHLQWHRKMQLEDEAFVSRV